MARKTMAERYATQRSRKVTRRRTLPRLSDTAGTATALQDNDFDDGDMDDGDLPATGATAISTLGLGTRTSTPTMPRRAPLDRAGRYNALAAAATTRVDYGYVRRDLRRIAITGVAMLALLLVLGFVLQALVH